MTKYQEMVALVDKDHPGLYAKMSKEEEKWSASVDIDAHFVGKKIREGYDRIEERNKK